ncbi:aminoglycoside phosphotransferase, partial [Pseudoalteromonas sp. S1688]
YIVGLREDIIAAIVKVYDEPVKAEVTAAEKQSIWLGAKVMHFMICLRFLTENIDGDNYFSVKYERHNLDRAKNQFALDRDIVIKQQVLKAMLTHI